MAGSKEIKRLYSISTKVKLKKEIGSSVSDYSEVFPGLPGIGLDGKESMNPVNGIVVREYSAKTGEIMLTSGDPAEVTFTVWYLGKEEKPSVIEFSYKYWISPKSPVDGKTVRPGEVSDRLLAGIQNETREWIADGGTKTGLVYKIQGSDQD